jgi:hypothetical protein
MPQLSPGDLVAQDNHTPAALRLLTAGATSWDGRILLLDNLTAEKLRDTAEKLARWLAQHATERGIAPVLAAWCTPHPAGLAPLHRRLYEALTPMLVSRNVSASSLVDMAAQVIGLGEGLTPSGDDFIVGFLAVLHLTGHTPAWPDALMANTTDLSAAFLRGALQGHFSEPLVRLVQALYDAAPCDWLTPAADVARVGHSSGVDAMVGIAFANQLLASVGTS